jgi:hypothetical protein|tara:strand:- start:42 stop:245 length:204 start_codon:yes stop_codon:yes gene_type:complete
MFSLSSAFLEIMEKKILQVVNLSPSESWIEKLTEVHPMRQVFWATVIQVSVFGFMLLSFFIIDKYLG